MTIDPMEISLQALIDFGETVTVTDPGTGIAVQVVMIHDDPDDDARLGQLPGNFNQPVFHCAPEDVGEMGRGWLLELDGVEYEVFDVLPRRRDLTEIRVKER